MRLFLLAAVLIPAVPLVGQVGYLPSQSPYQEITRGVFAEGSFGHVFGGGGALRVGPRDGASESARITIRAKNTLQFSFGGWTAGTVRSVIDAYDSVATRDKGLFNQRLIAGEIGVQMNLTGGKTWHGAAPFVGIGFGLVHGNGAVKSDTSGYSFGTKLYFAPFVGTRFFVGRSLYLRADVRALTWKLQYPSSYLIEPSKQPGTAEHPNAVDAQGIGSQYTISPELRIGFGIAW